MSNIKKSKEELLQEINSLKNKLKHTGEKVLTATASKSSNDQIQLSALIANLPGIAYRCNFDKHYTMLFISAGLEGIAGYKPEELINNSKIAFNDIIHPDDRAKVRQIIKKACEKKCSFEVKYRIITKFKEEKWVSEKGVQVSTKANIKILEGFISDISDLKNKSIQLENELAVMNQAENIAQLGNFQRNWQTGEGVWSDGFCKLLGIKEGSRKTHSEFMDFVHEDDKKRVNDHVKKSLKTGENMNIVFRIVQKSGKIITIHGTGENSYDKNGKLLSTRGIFQDVTDRHKTEESLAESEQKYRNLVEQSLQGMVIAQADPLRLSFVSSHMQKITGYTAKELESFTPKQLQGLIHPVDRARFFDNFKSRLNGKKIASRVEYRMIHKTGKTCWVEVFGVAIKYRNQPATQTVFMDITDRKILQEELVKAEEKYRKTFDNASDAINIIDFNGNVIDVNNAMVRLSGYSKKKLLTMKATELYPSFNKNKISKTRIAKLKAGKVVAKPFDTLFKTKSGILDVELTSTLLKDIYGKECVIQSNIRNITERKKTENKLITSEFRFRELVNTINSGVGVYKVNNNGASGRDYIIQDFNKKALSIENKKKSEVIGKSLKEIRPNIDEFGLISIFQKVWKTGKPAFYPAKIYVDEKFNNYYENRIYRLPSKEIVAVYDDVTEKYLREKKLKASEYRFSVAMDATSDGIFDWNLLTNEIYYSSGWKKILGYKENELENDFSVWENLTEPDGVKKAFTMLDDLKNKKIDKFELEFKMKHKSGHWVDILSRAKAVFDDSGKAVRVVGTHIDITSRNKQEKKYRDLFNNMLNGFALHKIILDPSGKPENYIYVDVNESFANQVGKTVNDIIGKKATELFSGIEQDSAVWLEKYFNIASGKGAERFEQYSEYFQKWFDIYAFSTEKGYFATISEDITQKKLALDKLNYERRQLKKSEEQFRTLFESSPFGTVICELIRDKNGKAIDFVHLKVNSATKNQTGWDANKILGKRALELASAEEMEKPLEIYGNIVKTGKASSYMQYFPLYGRTLEVTCFKLKGNIFILQFLDISQTIKDQKQLLKSKKDLRTFLDASPDMFYMKDLDLKYLLVNKANADFFGKSYSEIISKTDFDLMSAEFANICADSDKKAINTKQQVINKEYVKGHYYETRKIPVIEKGKVKAVVGTVRDITENVEMEEQKELLRNQLVQSQKMESMGVLAGGVAHDFNNILTAIMGDTELLIESESISSSVREDLENIKNSTKRAADLVKQLLAFSRKQLINMEALDLNEAIKKSNKMLSRLLGENIQVKLNLADEKVMILADEANINQILINFVVNASDAMPDGGQIIMTTKSVTLAPEDTISLGNIVSGDYIQFSFEDTGTGISKENIEQIFEPFFSTKPKDKGTGLGLSVVFGILKTHKAGINVYSELEKGTTFNIYFPKISKSKNKSVPSKTYDEHQGNGAKILVVEDESAIRNLLKRIFARKNYNTVFAANLSEAVEMYSEDPESFDLLFCDMVLPDGTGLNVLEQLNAVKPVKKILFSSGYLDDKSRWETIKDNNYPFIHKPYTIEDLLKTIEGVLI